MALDSEQRHVLGEILRIGRQRGAQPIEIRAAVATGLVESGLRNLPGGDADSAGWRQERASLYANPTNLTASINRFYNETKAVRGQYGRAGDLAAAVQRPAAQYRGRYQANMPEAKALIRRFGDQEAGRVVSGVGGAQATPQVPQAPDLGQPSGILATVTQALQAQTRAQGVGASAPALPGFAARPVAAGAGSPQAGVAPVAARQQRLGSAIQSVLAASDTSVPGMVSPAGAKPQTQAGAGGGVQGRTLYIGDSLGVGTEPNLKKLLGGHVDANVVGGRSSANGIEALKSMYGKRGYQNIVLDLGTNDMTAGQLAASVRAAQRIAPDARIYIPTLNGPFATRRKNRVLQRLAAADPNVELVPWRSHAQGNLSPDGIHATARGYESRAQLIARTMGVVPQQTAGGGGGSIRSLIHPHGHWGGSEGPTVALFKALGAPLGLTVASNKRHNINPYSGSRSDHDYGQKSSYAIDASNGSSPTPQMDEYAYRLMHALGFTGYRKGTPINTSQGVTTINGLRFQVIYRGSGAAYGGNHLNHVHLGVRRV